ncbi:MAG: glycosyltransferase family 4 protein [Candidatus Aminicenantes bacterium]|nr:glycosyltransferase family 4 protein [Candidatus Aminicenantes bacterium]
MKIAVDCYEAGSFATGVGRSIENVLKELVPMMPEDEFVALSREPIEKYVPPNIAQVVLSPDKGYFRWQNGPFRRNLKQIQPDILIAPNYTLPVFNRWKSILIVHDVSFISHPEWYSTKESLKRKFFVQRSVRKAEYVVVVSRTVKGELMKYLDVEPGKIEVVYHGVDNKFQKSPANRIIEWKKKKGLDNKLVVGYLGSIFNRRHIPVLVKSVELLRMDWPDLVLYIAGRDMTHPPQDVATLLNKDWILWEERLENDALPDFYSALDVFAYISEYEGFGLPPLEALACGTVPVVLNKSSLGEIYADIAFLADEPVVEQVAEALRTAIQDDLAKSLIFENFAQKRSLFSWKNSATGFKRLIDNIGKY